MSANGHHITPIKTYVATFLVLMVLMGLTVLVYVIDFGHIISTGLGLGSAAGSYLNNAIALTIAIVKATFVVLYFMGVKYSSKLTKLYAATGFVWVTLMGIMFCDYMTRGWEPATGFTPGDTSVSKPRSQIKNEIWPEKAPKSEAAGGGGH